MLLFIHFNTLIKILSQTLVVNFWMASPGVYNTCGENVFQCHKCRSINYDERDPFLCNSCGFCKFAKFDFTLVGRNCCAVRGGPQTDPAAHQQPPGARQQNLLHPFTAHKANSRVYDNQTKRTKCLWEAQRDQFQR